MRIMIKYNYLYIIENFALDVVDYYYFLKSCRYNYNRNSVYCELHRRYDHKNYRIRFYLTDQSGRCLINEDQLVNKNSFAMVYCNEQLGHISAFTKFLWTHECDVSFSLYNQYSCNLVKISKKFEIYKP